MSLAAVFAIGFLSGTWLRYEHHRRTLRGLQEELFWTRLHVDAAEPALESRIVFGRIARSAIERTQRIRERTR
jgi:hypothetical protein